MGVKRKLVAAVSEPYPDGTVRPPEELEAAVKRKRHVDLTLGHPPAIYDKDGTPKPGPVPENLLLGNVEYQYDPTTGRQLATMTFFEEYLDRLPEHIREKVVNNEPLPISQGYEHGWRDEQTIIDIMPHHLAVLLDEKPLCPLDKCGVNVRMESGSSYRYEQRAEATEEGITMSEEPKPDPIEGLRKEVQELKDLVRESLKPREEPEPVVVEREAPAAEPEPEPPQVPVRAPVGEPVRDIPASAPASGGDGLQRDPITGGIIQQLVKKKKHDRS